MSLCPKVLSVLLGIASLLLATEGDIEWVSSYGFGGAGEVIYDYSGERAFLASGAGVYILDVSDFSSPEIISADINTASRVDYMLHRGSNLIIALKSNEFQPWDIGWSPRRLTSYKLDAYPRFMKLHQNYLYVIQGDNTLDIFYIISLANPRLITSLDFDTMVLSFDVYAYTGYIALNDGKVEIVDLQNPYEPTVVDSIVFTGNALKVRVEEDYLIVLLDSGELRLYDLHEPANPEYISSYTLDTLPNHISFFENIIHLAFASGRILTLEIDDSDNFQFSASCTTEVDISSLAASPSVLLAGDTIDQQLNLITPSCSLLATFPTPGLAPLFVKQGYFVHLFYPDVGKLLFLDMRSPEDYYIISQIDNLPSAELLASHQNYSWLAGEKLYLIDFTNHWEPILVDSFNLLNSPTQLEVNENLMVAADTDGIKLIDVTEPLSPSQISVLPVSGNVVDLKLSENFLLVAIEDEGVKIYDVETPSEPSLVETIAMDGIFAVQVDPPYILVGNYSSGLNLFRIRSDGLVECQNMYVIPPYKFAMDYPLIWVHKAPLLKLYSFLSSDSFALANSCSIWTNPNRMRADSTFLYFNTTYTGLQFYRYTGSIAPYSQSVSLNTGWNLISIPISATISVEGFPRFIIPPTYYYSPDARRYNPVSTLEDGKGYWILSREDTSLVFSGIPSTELNSVLLPGWNMVGCASGTIPLSDLTDISDSIIPPVYEYRDRRYFSVDLLFPGKGYWVLSTDTVNININTGDSR